MPVMGKREQLLEAATKLILKKGYSHTSVEDITNEMGIAKGSFYTYFKSKNLLLQTIAEKKIEEMVEKQDGILENSLSFEETLKNIILVRLKFSHESMKRELVLISLIKNIEALSPENREILKNEFISSVSHELRTPVNLILSSIQVLKLKLSTLDKENYNYFSNYIKTWNKYLLLHLKSVYLYMEEVHSKTFPVRFHQPLF